MTMWYEFLTFQWRHMSIMVSQVMVNSTALSTGCWGPTRKTSKLSITGLEGVHRRLGWCVASVHWWTGSALVQVKVCRLFGAKTLLWLLPTNCQLRPWEQTSVKFYVASRWLCYLLIAIPTSQWMPNNMIEISQLLLIASTECVQYGFCRRIRPSALGALVLYLLCFLYPLFLGLLHWYWYADPGDSLVFPVVMHQVNIVRN